MCGTSFSFKIRMHALADANEAVFVAAGKTEQLVRLLRVGHEFRRRLRVWRGRKTADPGESVEVCQPEIQRLPAAHREKTEKKNPNFHTSKQRNSVFENKRSKFVKAASPRLPFVGGAWRFVINAVNARLFQSFDVRLGGGAVLFAAVTHEDKFRLLLKRCHIGNVRQSNAAAAENADMREFIEMR